MAPKEPKSDEEVLKLLGMVKDYWPNFEINSQVLQNPTSEFVIRFFTDFLAEINDKVSYLLNEDVSETADPKDFDAEVYLFRRVSKIFRAMKLGTFCLMDIYSPVPRRTRCYIKNAIHYLIFINNQLEDWEKLTNGVFKRADEMAQLQTEKQELLKEVNETAAAVAKTEDRSQALLAEKVVVAEEYEKMLDDKHIKNQVYAEKQLEIERLTNECENEEYQLARLEQEETGLKEQQITEHDYEILKNMEKSLQHELKRVSCNDNCLGDGLDEQKQNVDFIESCALKLERLNMDSLSEKIQVLKKLNDQLEKHDTENAELTENVRLMQTTLDKLKIEIQELSEELNCKEENLLILEKKTESDLEELRSKHDKQSKKTMDKLKQATQLHIVMKDLKKEIARIQSNKENVKHACKIVYKKLLDNKESVLKNVYDTLYKINLAIVSSNKEKQCTST